MKRRILTTSACGPRRGAGVVLEAPEVGTLEGLLVLLRRGSPLKDTNESVSSGDQT